MNMLDRIKLLVEQKGITLAELERRSSLTNGAIRRWVDHIPSVDKLQRVAKELNTTLDYLINGEENEKGTILSRKALELNDTNYDIINAMIDKMIESQK